MYNIYIHTWYILVHQHCCLHQHQHCCLHQLLPSPETDCMFTTVVGARDTTIQRPMSVVFLFWTNLAPVKGCWFLLWGSLYFMTFPLSIIEILLASLWLWWTSGRINQSLPKERSCMFNTPPVICHLLSWWHCTVSPSCTSQPVHEGTDCNS